MRVFILGASDPEMEEIEAVLTAHNEEFRYATVHGRRVYAQCAYDANNVSARIPKNAEIVFVECHVLGLATSATIDHHREGDPGFGRPPSDYLEGSSLGQLLKMLNCEPTPLQRIIAAADHCPTQAYRGECPLVNPTDLAHWRTLSRAKRRGVTFDEMNAAILRGKALLDSAEKIEVGSEQVSIMHNRDDEIPEASARFDIPFVYKGTSPAGSIKYGIMGAKPDTIAVWMAQCELSNVYGDPVRGYAGGYA
ncbi:MAG: hypothetical protein Q7S87_05215 [Agitococcus sp.]|nr:hypothetical protein [Agitococcus sp.]MDO9179189.1 hypothetical protein [Agitococcus sp.]